MGHHQVEQYLHYRHCRGDQRETGVESLLEEIMAKNFTSLMRKMGTTVEEA